MSESDAKRMRTDSGMRPVTVEERLHRLSLEVEAITEKGSQEKVFERTYRATLASHGYLVQRTLGSGSYSKVKTALNCRNSEHIPVAVKIINKLSAPREYQAKFLPRELQTWPKLKHPNIIQLYHTFEDKRYLYMVLEFAPRGDALHYVQKNGALEERLARSWALQLGDAVAYMHRQDIAHRDLKLENLLLDRHGRLKLADFGFVKESCSGNLSHTYCGSKSYAAPEILEGRPYPPTKADVWAYAVILYILTTGRMPFDESRGSLHILSEQRILSFDWSKHNISQPCRDVIMSAFVWSFDRRPTMREVLSLAWFHNKPATSRPVTVSSSSRRLGLPIPRIKRTASAQGPGHCSI